MQYTLSIYFFLLAISIQVSFAQEQDLFLELANAARNLQTTYDCGGENEEPCGADTAFFWENGNYFCDRGLKPTDSSLQALYFLKKGEFLKAITTLPKEQLINPLGSCVNNTRAQTIVTKFKETWQHWAIHKQLELAQHDPINTVMLLAAHNAYNNTADGYSLPNQHYSITDQLRLGARVIMLDVHYAAASFWTGKAASLCHGLGNHIGCSSSNRMFSSAIKEIATWLERPDNQQAVIIIEIQVALNKYSDASQINDPIKNYLGDLVFKPKDKNPSRWPTLAEMVTTNKRVIILWQKDISFASEYLFKGKWSGQYKEDLKSAYIRHFRADTCTSNKNIDLTQRLHYFDKFSEVYEDRSKASPIRIYVGKITQQNLADLANCNINIIGLDQLLNVEGFNRLKGLVWSWQEGDRGQFGKAVVQITSGRWASRNPLEKHPFACLPKRAGISEADFERLDPLDYGKVQAYRLHQDKLGVDWQITSRSGAWSEGDETCLEQFGKDYVFSVPTNGYQNRKLLEKNYSKKELWLNFAN